VAFDVAQADFAGLVTASAAGAQLKRQPLEGDSFIFDPDGHKRKFVGSLDTRLKAMTGDLQTTW
jgi:hypothetical protein